MNSIKQINILSMNKLKYIVLFFLGILPEVSFAITADAASAGLIVTTFIDAITTATFATVEKNAMFSSGINTVFYALLGFSIIWQLIAVFKKLQNGKSFGEASWKFVIFLAIVFVKSTTSFCLSVSC